MSGFSIAVASVCRTLKRIVHPASVRTLGDLVRDRCVTCRFSILVRRETVEFSSPGVRRSNRRGYSRSESRISLVLGPGIEKNLAHHASSALLRDAASSLRASPPPKPEGAGGRRACAAPAARSLRPDAIQTQAYTARSRFFGWHCPGVVRENPVQPEIVRLSRAR